MYKATGDQTFLSYAENNYDSYGGGNTPGEFSWDNKHAGVQVRICRPKKPQSQPFLLSLVPYSTLFCCLDSILSVDIKSAEK